MARVETTFLMRRVNQLLEQAANLPNGSAEQLQFTISTFALLDRVLELHGIPVEAPSFSELDVRPAQNRRQTIRQRSSRAARP